jgi:hypothetical protein
MNKQHTQLVDRLEASSNELADAVGRLSPAQIARIPKADEWSLHANLAHVRDTEVQVFLYRIDRVLSEDEPPAVPVFSQEEWNVEHYDADEPTRDILAEFRAARRKLVKLLRGTRDKDWARYAVHPQYGNIPIEWLAQHTYTHTLEHLQQFLLVYEADLLAKANRG